MRKFISSTFSSTSERAYVLLKSDSVSFITKRELFYRMIPGHEFRLHVSNGGHGQVHPKMGPCVDHRHTQVVSTCISMDLVQVTYKKVKLRGTDRR